MSYPDSSEAEEDEDEDDEELSSGGAWGENMGERQKDWPSPDELPMDDG